MKFCPDCGSKLEKGSKFCGDCGFKIRKSTRESREDTSPSHLDHQIYVKEKRGHGKVIAVIAILAIVLLGVFLLPRLWVVGAVTGTSLPLMMPPEVEVYDTQLSGIGLGGFTLALTLDVYNPNPQPITFDRADFDVYINDKNVGSGSLLNSVSVSGNSHSYPTTSMRVSYGGALSGAWEYIKGAFGDGTIMKISGIAYVNVPILGDIPIPFSHSERI